MSNGNISTIDGLRGEIQQKNRFKTVAFGFDKASVHEYVASLVKNFEEVTENLKEERDGLLREREEMSNLLAGAGDRLTELKAKLGEHERLIARMRLALEQQERERLTLQETLQAQDAELREIGQFKKEYERMRAENGQLSAQHSMLESVILESKAVNARQNEENSRRGARIAQLEEQLALREKDACDALSLVEVLSSKTAVMLQEKITECADLIAAWQAETCGTITSAKDRLGNDRA